MRRKKILTWLFIVISFLYNDYSSAQSLPLGTKNYQIRDVSTEDFSNLDFTRHRLKADFNEDGVADTVSCNNALRSVTITDGVDKNKVKTLWTGPSEWVRPAWDGKKLTFSFVGCQIVDLADRPHIVVSTLLSHEIYGARVRSLQHVIVNKGNMQFKRQDLRYNYAGTMRPYFVASRSVKCKNYPRKLVDAGYSPGSLCFFSGYDAGGQETSSKYGTNTALLKLEMSSTGEIIAKDLTPTSSLPWRGGAFGTDYKAFPMLWGKYVNLHMMDSAFIDVNDDGLLDLITVAQHANPYFSQMIMDTSRPEGLRFTVSRMVGSGYETMTEFLTINSFDEVHPHLKSAKCLFLSGENEGSGKVYDHLRCYENNRWVRYLLPGTQEYSWYNRGLVAADGQSRLILRARQVVGESVLTKYFSLNFEGPLQSRAYSTVVGSNFVIEGFACQQNSESPHSIVVTDGDRAHGGRALASVDANRPMGPIAKEKCLQSNNPTHVTNFKANIPLNLLSEIDNVFVYAVDSDGQYTFIRTLPVE